jgi:hypothetical protein
MIQRAGRLRLAKQTRSRDVVFDGRGRDELENDFPVEPLVFGEIHDPHSAGAKLRQHAIVRDESSLHLDVLRAPDYNAACSGQGLQPRERVRP